MVKHTQTIRRQFDLYISKDISEAATGGVLKKGVLKKFCEN